MLLYQHQSKSVSEKRNLSPESLSRRERQVMDVLLANDEITAAEIRKLMGDEPSYSAVRAVLRVLVEKGLVSHHYEGPRYVYKTTVSRQAAKKAAVKRLLDTLFEGSREQLLATLLYLEDDEASSKELKRLARLIEKARAHAR